MPDGTESDFDADLNAMLNEGADTATPQSGQTQTQSSEAAKLKFGGREWDSPEKLGKAYEALHKDYTRKSQDYSRLKPYGDFDSYLNKHPELRSKINEAVQEYNKRVSAGQPKATAEAATGVPRELADRIERMEAHFEDQKIDQEKSSLSQKYSLDKEDMRLVIHKAIEFEEKGIPNLSLEDVFKIMAFEERNLQAKKDGEKTGAEKIIGKKKAAIGGSDSQSMTPSAKGVTDMNESEYTNALNDKLKGLGYSG